MAATTTEKQALPRYALRTPCLACKRDTHQQACDLCCRLEDAEQAATGQRSPQLHRFTRKVSL